MSEPSTELFDKLQKFMRMSPEHRDESLWLQDNQFKGQIRDMDEKVVRLVKSNAALQKAIYIGTGMGVAVKIYLDYFKKP
jgi:hypothetical protein